MPAIQPVRLKRQSALLVEQFNNPAAFIRSLHHLLEFYADRVHRPGQAREPSPLIQAYLVKPPILRQILMDLEPLVKEKPDQALELCDQLWVQPYLEFRQLSASILGAIPLSSSAAILERVRGWIRQDTEDRLIDVIILHGLENLRKEDPRSIYRLINEWLAANEVHYQKVGLRTLLPLVQEPDMENLPIFFNLIQPFARSLPTSISPDLIDIVEVLARRSPQETAYFLRQMLSFPNSPDTPWLIRQVIKFFPTEIQASLRKALKEKKDEVD